MKWFKSSKENKQFPKMIAAYLSKEYNQILVAPYYVDESCLRYEQEEIDVFSYDVDNNTLGDSIKGNLNKFKAKNQDSGTKNKKDWPAFKASKLKTIKEFESKFQRIAISGLNEANIILAFDAETDSKDEIHLRTTISAYADNETLAERLRKLHKAQLDKKIE